DNPNGVSPDQAEVDFIYNNVQLNFATYFNELDDEAAGYARMKALTAFNAVTYDNQDNPSNFNFLWNLAYAQILPDVDALVEVGAENGLVLYTGSAKIMKAYVMVTLVDLFGDVPYSQAGLGVENFNPGVDAGADVYQAAFDLLDEAIAELNDPDGSTAAPAYDNFYNGNGDNWVAAANSLKVRMYNTIRLVDGGAVAAAQNLIDNANIIDSPDEDFEFKYGTNRLNPNTRHPYYNDFYEENDGFYQANYFMWLLVGEKRDIDASGNFALDANGNTTVAIEDPRLPFYFYRQDGSLAGESSTVWECWLTALPYANEVGDLRPAHYSAVDRDMPYCIVTEDGYFGRDHINGGGIPPDGAIRTVWGIYPGGGKFDYADFENIQNAGIDGALGQGINPIIQSSFIHFMRAEMAMAGGNQATARAQLTAGVRASMDKVFSFSDLLDPSLVVSSNAATGESLTLAEVYLDSFDDNVDDYVDYVQERFDASSDKMDVIMKEYMIALYGNGIEAYNNLRRTGKPANIQPGIDPTTTQSGFTRSFYYPANYVDLVAGSPDQKDHTDPVFWDNNPADFVR
ncbi:unnamed protein product, partial [Symbiodinium microadriaticum]